MVPKDIFNKVLHKEEHGYSVVIMFGLDFLRESLQSFISYWIS